MNSYVAYFIANGVRTGGFTTLFARTDSQAVLRAKDLLTKQNTMSDGYVVAERKYNRDRLIASINF